MNRKTNSGPYVVSYEDYWNPMQEKEFQLWSDACQFMRQCLIENKFNVSVRFV